MKPKVAFFEFADCEGCQLCVLDLTPEQLLNLIDVIDIVEFREAISEKSETYDVAIVEGSITRESDIPRLKKIRETAKVLVALATMEGVPKNRRVGKVTKVPPPATALIAPPAAAARSPGSSPPPPGGGPRRRPPGRRRRAAAPGGPARPRSAPGRCRRRRNR